MTVRTLMNRRLLLGAAVAAPSVALVAAAFATPGAQPASPPGKGRFPNVTLTRHHGQQVRFYDDVIRGNKVNIINMMYTQCPDVRGGALANMAWAQKLLGERMGREMFMYSITLDPSQDTPKVLARHAELLGAGAGWTFLTGQEADIQRLRRALGFVDIDPVVDRDLRAHTGMLRAGNDSLDRWISCPAWAPSKQLAQSALWIGIGSNAGLGSGPASGRTT